MKLSTFPEMDILQRYADATPDYMRPNTIPYAAIAEGYLSDEQCDAIVTRLMKFKSYRSPKCGAVSRECGHVPELDVVRDFAFQMNDLFWGYDLDEAPYTWLQSYSEGGNYQLHMDAAPGRMRKLTAVTMLNDPKWYMNGELTIHFHPEKVVIPKTRGTIVVFQPWLLHEVSVVTYGDRMTTNTSFWGPPFK